MDDKDTVSRFEHDKVMMHMNWANRRMLIALVTVCVTFIVTILVFVHGYTEREKNWLDTLNRYVPVTEAADGKKSTE